MDTVVSSSSLLPIPPFTSIRSSLTSTSYNSLTTKFPLNLSSSKKTSLLFYTQKNQLGRHQQHRRSPSSSSKLSIAAIQEINETQFEEAVLKSELPVLVEFVATWCGPCRLISPAMEWLAQEYKDKLTVVKIDHDANPRLIEEYKVYGLPALILFKNGQEIPESRREGAITKVKLKDYVDAFLESVSVA